MLRWQLFASLDSLGRFNELVNVNVCFLAAVCAYHLDHSAHLHGRLVNFLFAHSDLQKDLLYSAQFDFIFISELSREQAESILHINIVVLRGGFQREYCQEFL